MPLKPDSSADIRFVAEGDPIQMVYETAQREPVPIIFARPLGYEPGNEPVVRRSLPDHMSTFGECLYGQGFSCW